MILTCGSPVPSLTCARRPENELFHIPVEGVTIVTTVSVNPPLLLTVRRWILRTFLQASRRSVGWKRPLLSRVSLIVQTMPKCVKSPEHTTPATKGKLSWYRYILLYTHHWYRPMGSHSIKRRGPEQRHWHCHGAAYLDLVHSLKGFWKLHGE